MTAPTFGPVVQVEPAGPAAAGSFARTSLGFILWVPQPEGAPAPSARGGAPASSGRKAPAPPPAARRCALCGREGSTPRLGGLACYSVITGAMRAAGIGRDASSSYLHVRCARAAQSKLVSLGRRP